MTVTVVGSEAVLRMSSRAWIVTSYTLSLPESSGSSKFAKFLKVTFPAYMAKRPPSAPESDQAISLLSGSVALKVWIAAVPFSLTVKSVLLMVVMLGGSLTSVTVTVTDR